MTQDLAPTQPNDSAPNTGTTEVRLNSWEEFIGHVSSFDDPQRSLWDEVWFRGQADARWPLYTTLERRSQKIRRVHAYLRLIAEIKPAIEVFTGIQNADSEGNRRAMPPVRSFSMVFT
jgi:hypothetical protein